MWTFNRAYFLLTILLFGIEVLIAVFLNDPIIRPYVGDLLVVVLIYCAVRTFINGPVLPIAIGVLVFAYIIEFSQYLRLIDHLGLRHNRLANLVMGNRFEWIDMLAYTLGALCVIITESIHQKVKLKRDFKNNPATP